MADYKPYTDEEREAVARRRLGQLMQAIGELDAAKTYLLFTWSQLAAAGAHGDQARIEAVAGLLRSDISDVEAAAQQFAATFHKVLAEIESEYRAAAEHGQRSE